MEENKILSIHNSIPLDLNVIQEDGIRIEFVPSNRKKVKKINIHISGEFSILNANLAMDKLNQVISHFDCVNIYLKNIVSFDLAAIQCLYKLKVTQASIGKTISLESEFPKECNDLISISGFLPILTTIKLTA